MWKNQGSWNFFHTKLIPNSSIKREKNKITDIVINHKRGFMPNKHEPSYRIRT